MKKIVINSFIILILAVFAAGCKKSNYPGGEVSAYIPIFDLRNLYKGGDLTLSPDVMYGSSSITAVVISDHSGNNLPSGLLIVQDKRRLDELRGMSIQIGADAKNYVPGDSVIINVAGGVLHRVDGILQITGLTNSSVQKVASGVEIAKNGVPSTFIMKDPNKYESTLVAIVKGGFDPLPTPTDVLAGDRILNDGFGDFTLHTEATATFANNPLSFSANYYGIIFNSVNASGGLVPHQRLRTADDIVTLSSTPEIPDFIISGWIPDPRGTNENYNYMQFIATRDINFATTPFAVVVTNNAGTAPPIGFPTNSWVTGGRRSYQYNIISGNVPKGGYFYVGGTGKRINSSNSAVIPNNQYVLSYNSVSNVGANGNGDKVSNVFAGSGNASGIAAFRGKVVTKDSRPIDVVFIGGGGTLFNGTDIGYRITNTDFYDVYDPLEVDKNDPTKGYQPFYRQGTNILFFNYHPTVEPADYGYFYKAGGIYSVTLGKWVKARDVKHIHLVKDNDARNPWGEPASTLTTIEDDNIEIYRNAAGVEIRRDTIAPTRIK